MTLSRLLPAGCFLFAAGLLVGCGESHPPLPMANVSGSVTLDGKSLEKGTIAFSAEGRPPMVFEIRDGKYQGSAMVGTNVVSISAKKAAPTGGKDLSGGRAAQQGGSTEVEAIDSSFNTKTKETRTVEAGGANQFNFECKSPVKK